jgi:hypothetical protein
MVRNGPIYDARPGSYCGKIHEDESKCNLMGRALPEADPESTRLALRRVVIDLCEGSWLGRGMSTDETVDDGNAVGALT